MRPQAIAVAIAVVMAAASISMANDFGLPDRETPIPRTTDNVPHVQLGVKADPELSQRLLDRVAELPHVILGPTQVSLPGAVGFQLEADLQLARPEVVVGGREFAHLHPDGSLHASMDPQLVRAAVESGWAVAHPWADLREGWEGFAMIFTPTNPTELEVVIALVERSYSFVTGIEVEAE